MGGADIIPGVSGGTVALIVGIYDRLVTAISRVDLTLLAHLRARRWHDAATHVDLRFLLALGFGIGFGIVTLGGLMNTLLSSGQTRPLALAGFSGAIIASSILVARMVRSNTPAQTAGNAALGLAGAAFAYWLTQLSAVDAEPTLGYLFLCGAVAICAMILPGISGAYVLVLLGTYAHLTEILKGLPHGHVGTAELTTVAIFGAGCATGLLAFSKVLRWLLASHQSPTMAILCGFMIGALVKIWPFQSDLTPDETKLKHKVFEPFVPEQIDTKVCLVVVICAATLGAVFLLDRLTQGHEKPLFDGKEG